MNENRCECIHMWTIISEEDCSKKEALTIMGYDFFTLPYALCFACKEDKKYTDDCSHCPITWGVGPYAHCSDKNTAFDNWENAQTPHDRKYYAREMIHLIESTWKEDDD